MARNVALSACNCKMVTSNARSVVCGSRVSVARKHPPKTQTHQMKQTRPQRVSSNVSNPVICRASSIDLGTEVAELTLDLNTRDLQQSVVFAAVPFGRGKAIIIQSVAEGSLAQEAGITRGQRLLAISDPVRPELWRLNERASLRYIRDAVRMQRREDLTLIVSSSPLSTDTTPATTTTAPAAAPSSLPSSAEASDCDTNSDMEDCVALLDMITSDDDESRNDEETRESTSTTASITSSGGGGTIGERLEQKHKIAMSPNGQMSDFEKRLAKRKERMEQVKKRNDAPFFLGLAAAFLAPALVILGVAAQSGYLEQLLMKQVW